MEEEGTDLADLHAARAFAVKSVRSLAAETVRDGHITAHHRIEIEDELYNLIDTVTFGAAVDMRE